MDEELERLVRLVFDRKEIQCPRCFYFGDGNAFPVGTNYDKNNNYVEQSLIICPVCREIFN